MFTLSAALPTILSALSETFRWRQPPLRQLLSGLLTLSLLISARVGLDAQALTQSTIRGRVSEASTNRPIPFASVYINASTRGTTADAEGRYQLTGIPAGTVELVASAVGFKTGRQTIRVSSEQGRRLDFALTPATNALQTVTVTAKRAGAYNRLMRRFRRELLGNSSFADQCAILNLDQVILTEKEGSLEAQATQPLVIENKALGYRLHYQLTHFDSFRQATHYGGTSRFEALRPEHAEQTERWERNRQKAYRGSVRHLLASLVAGTYQQQGFLVYEANFDVPVDPSIPLAQLGRERPVIAVRPDSLLKRAELPSERQLYSRKPLEVFYTRQHALSTPYRDLPYAYSVVYMPKGRALITTDGWVAQPNGLEVRGAMSDDRLATLLPADWRPVPTTPAYVASLPDVGQLLPADTLLKTLAQQWSAQLRNPAPTVFLHTDKAVYATGDQLWFSGLVLDPTTQQPFVRDVSTAENPLHLELAAPNGRLVYHQWLRVGEGRVSGGFRLSDSLATGSYRLRAYAQADIGNARPAFERTLIILNGLTLGIDLPSGSASFTPDSLDVQFLPEGGHWVAGLPARLGIKALDRRGKGVALTGRIRSAQGGEAVRFVTNRLGMGSVELLPSAGQRYTAEVQTATSNANGTANGLFQFSLPDVDATGLVLAADIVTDSSRLVVRVRASAQLAAQPVYLTVQSRGQLAQQTKLQLQQGQARLSIPADKLPAGIAQVTLFDAHGLPQAERLVFIPERLLPIQARLSTDKAAYQPREALTLSLSLADGFGEPLSMLGSASITDAGQLPTDTSSADIRTHLLLTGELRGRIEDPRFYLSSTQRTGRRALDDLLLTQGWRRVGWRFGADTTATAGASGSGLLVSGRVVDRRSRPLPLVNVLLTFISRTGDSFARSARTDERGEFVLANVGLTDTVTVRSQITSLSFKSMPSARVLLSSPGNYFTPSDSLALIAWPQLRPLLPTIQQRQASTPNQYRDQDARQLKEVTVRAAKPDDDRQARRVSLHAQADATVRFDINARSFGNAYEMLAGKVPGVQVRKKTMGEPGGLSDGYVVRVRGSSTFGQSDPPLYLVDGMNLAENAEGTALLMLNPGEVERIEVLKNGGGAMYGARGGAGVIAFYLKSANSPTSKAVAKSEPPLTRYGYLTERQFYAPRYGSQPDEAVNQADRRDVLHWQPLVATNRQGVNTMRFFLSDIVRAVRVTLQGITLDGRPIYVDQVINVK